MALRNNHNDSSMLVKPPAIVVWLAICVLAVLFEKTALGFFAGFVFLLTLSSYSWARVSLKNVEFELSVDRIGMFPGQSFAVTRVVRNMKALPMLWAEIREDCGVSDCASPKADVIVANEIFHDSEKGSETVYERLYALSFVGWRRAVRFRDEWQAKRRGILEIPASLVRSGDGFGLCAEEKSFVFERPKRVVVYPRLARASAGSILNDMWDTSAESYGFLKDRTIIKSVRDYLPGDAARDVNMRLYARGQELKTNVYETVKPDTILFALDAGSFKGCDPAAFERALSVLASLIEELTGRGIQTALMAPASKWFGETCTEPSSAEREKYRMFELLAAASAEDEGFSPAVSLPSGEPGRVYIVCAEEKRLTLRAGALPYPEQKIRLLTAGASGGGAEGALSTQSIFDFERA